MATYMGIFETNGNFLQQMAAAFDNKWQLLALLQRNGSFYQRMSTFGNSFVFETLPMVLYLSKIWFLHLQSSVYTYNQYMNQTFNRCSLLRHTLPTLFNRHNFKLVGGLASNDFHPFCNHHYLYHCDHNKNI